MAPPGANLPWFSYGGDFGANAWRPAGGLSTRDLRELDRTFAAARRAGAEVIRWFVFCDGRAGFTWQGSAAPLLQAVVIADMEAALQALADHDLRMVPVLLDFTWTDRRRHVNGVQVGGRAHVLRDPVQRHRLWSAIDGMVGTFGDDRRIAAWDLWNEPEWMCAASRSPSQRLSRRLVRQCLAELALHVRWHARQPITVGLASVRGLSLCRALPLDLLQVHWYDHLERAAPLARRPHAPWTQAPLVLGEFPTRGSARSVDEIHRGARAAGYAAAWPWSLRADDDASDPRHALAAIDPARGSRHDV